MGESLNDLLRDALRRVEETPEGELSLAWRYRIYRALGKTQVRKFAADEQDCLQRAGFSDNQRRRTNLDLLVASLALPLWERYLPDALTHCRYLPHLFLHATERLIAGDLSLANAAQLIGKTVDRSIDDNDVDSVAAILGLRNQGDELAPIFANRFLYPPHLALPKGWGDPNYVNPRGLGYIATTALCRAFPSPEPEVEVFADDEDDKDSSEYDDPAYWGRGICKPKDYWNWWLKVAVPYAYQSVPDELWE